VHVESIVNKQTHTLTDFLSWGQSTLALSYPICPICNFTNIHSCTLVCIYTQIYIYMWKILFCWNQCPCSLQFQWNDSLNLCAIYCILLYDLQAINNIYYTAF